MASWGKDSQLVCHYVLLSVVVWIVYFSLTEPHTHILAMAHNVWSMSLPSPSPWFLGLIICPVLTSKMWSDVTCADFWNAVGPVSLLFGDHRETCPFGLDFEVWHVEQICGSQPAAMRSWPGTWSEAAQLNTAWISQTVACNDKEKRTIPCYSELLSFGVCCHKALL